MKKLFSHCAKVHDGITNLAYWLGVLALLAILCMFCYEITARYFFRSPTQWISDYTGYALLFSTFLLAPRITKNRGHIEITFIRDALPPRPQHVFSAMLFMAAAAACIWAGWYAVEEAMRQYDRGIRTMAVVSVPRWWMSAAIAYGFINSGLYFIRASIEDIRAIKSERIAQPN